MAARRRALNVPNHAIWCRNDALVRLHYDLARFYASVRGRAVRIDIYHDAAVDERPNLVFMP